MNKKKVQNIVTQFYIKDIQFTELNNHVGWTTEIIYVNKAKDMYILLFIQAWVKNITTFVLFKINLLTLFDLRIQIQSNNRPSYITLSQAVKSLII